MKNFKYLFIFSFAVFSFSLVFSSNTFATNNNLQAVEGFNLRETVNAGKLQYNLSCKYEQVGEYNFFPITAGNTPCGDVILNGNLTHYNDYSNVNSQMSVRFSYNNGTLEDYLGNWYSALKGSLYDGYDYSPINYVSAFDYIEAGNGFQTEQSYGDSYLSHTPSENSYDFLVLTFNNTNYQDWFYNGFPLLSERSNITITSGNGNAENIRNLINSSIFSGWTWFENGEFHSTLEEVFSDGEDFSPISSYLESLPEFTYFVVVGLPQYTDMTYSISNFRFQTPSTLSKYNFDFDRIENLNSYYGQPMLYSRPYSKIAPGQIVGLDPFYTEMSINRLSQLYVRPDTSEALSASNSVFGSFVLMHTNQLRKMSDLSKIDPNPGTSFWGNIFDLSNIFFPLRAFFSGFTSDQCVNIPIISGMLGGSPNQQYCTWWSPNIRTILTPIFNIGSMMLLTGFIFKWLRNKDSDVLEHVEET